MEFKRYAAALFVLLCLAITQAGSLQAAPESSDKTSVVNNTEALKTGTREYTAYTADSGGLLMPFPEGGEAVYTVDVAEEGYYNLAVIFEPDENLLSNINISVEINGVVPFPGADNIRIYTEWTDSGEIMTDRYGNESVPMQELIVKEYTVKLIDSKGDYVYPYAFYFNKGINEIKITNIRTKFNISDEIKITPVTPVLSYEQYISLYSSEKVIDNINTYEAENAYSKNKTSVLPEASRDPSVTPYDTKYLRINFIGGEDNFTEGGQVNWEITVPETGLYYISFKIKQLSDEMVNAPAFRTIRIDGEIPFEELACYRFDYSNKWINHTLKDSDGNGYLFYLTEGNHMLSMAICNYVFTDVAELLNSMINDINDYTLLIKKMTGNVTDKNREWDLTEYLPDAQDTLNGWVDNLQNIYDYLLELSNKNAKYVTFTGKALRMMINIAKDPNDLPNQLSALSTGSKSVSTELSNILSYVEYQPMAVDKFYVHGQNDLPNPEVSAFVKAVESVKRFFGTFQKQAFALDSQNKDELVVWTNSGRDYAALLQQMIDTEFTPKTGINVTLSIIADEKKMILSNASGSNPDMVIGASTNYPYELAMRGAAADLSKMDGFFELAQTVQPGSLISYMVDESVYAIPETQDFWALFYRKDILSKLNLSVPETWDDVIEMLPTLQRYGMNFSTNIAAFESTKPLQATIPFIYQFGGELLSEDGRTTAIDSEKSLKGIKFMTDLFNIYSTPERVANLYISMQRGEIPIGIGNFATYLMLSFGSDDMTGKWDIAPLPGIADENGNINRQAPGAAKCSIIFENSERKDEAWEFLKWYASTETQTNYGNRLYMTYGDGYFLNTSNIEAFTNMQIPDEHKKVILEQWESLVELPRIPGYYMIERELSNVWTKVVVNGKLLRESVDDASILINREIYRKMEEFGYISDGEMVKPYNVPTVESISAWLERGAANEK